MTPPAEPTPAPGPPPGPIPRLLSRLARRRGRTRPEPRHCHVLRPGDDVPPGCAPLPPPELRWTYGAVLPFRAESPDPTARIDLAHQALAEHGASVARARGVRLATDHPLRVIVVPVRTTWQTHDDAWNGDEATEPTLTHERTTLAGATELHMKALWRRAEPAVEGEGAS